MDDRKNERFGRYEILNELGRGAMGIVYKARDPKINRVVAVKTICLSGQPPEEEKEYRERFYREAEAAGRLSHPGIVTIFDVGEEPETHAPYIVMEYVAGQTLEKLLMSRADHRLPTEAALQATLELAEALDCAHGQGVVHRDLKPANILVAEDGHVKIADFGVAKLNLANATLAGRTLGTPAYMSPEQLSGTSVDGRSDLFSLGVVLYTVLTGYRPFQGNSVLTVAFKVVNRDPIPATVLDTDLPPGLDYIISKAIAKDPSQRYQRGMELALDIQELQEGREPWSKAKHPDAAGAVPQAEKENAGPALVTTRVGAPGQRTSKRGEKLRRGPADWLLPKMRSNAVAGALLLLGLSAFGWSVGRAFFRKPAPSKTVLHPETPAQIVEVATTPPVEAEAQDIPVPQTELEPVTETPRKTKTSAPKHTLVTSVPMHSKVTNVSTAPVASTVSVAPAMLEVEVDHKFTEAHMSIWVDEHLTYTCVLEGTDKKRLAMFHHVQGHEFHAMPVPSGKHLVRVQVIPDATAAEQSGTVEGEFDSSAEKRLRVEFSKAGVMKLSLQ